MLTLMTARLLLCFLAMAAIAGAQSTTATGAIQGRVSDASDAPMPGVRVRAVAPGSSAARETMTDESGQFRFTGLPVGNYELRLEKEGFATVRVAASSVSVGQTVAHRIEMKPGQVIESIEVKEQAEALDAAATTSSAALGGERIEESPAQNRNYLNFVLVAPGVAASAGSNAQRSGAGLRSAAPDSGFSFGGLRGRNNSLSIDGVDNRDETTGGIRVAIGLEMVQEFRVAGATVGAEFGGAAGGAVNVVTRSGTNVWHGDATFFAQNERFNARNPEAAVAHRPRFRRYQPGVSVNGPIRRDRAFFATALEQELDASEEWSDTPQEALEAINRALRRPEFSASAPREASRGLFPASDRTTEFSFKLNHQFHAVHTVAVRYAFSRGRVGGDVQGGENFADRSSRGSSLTGDHSLVAAWIAVPGPRVVNDLRVQRARRSAELTPNSRGAMLEIPGVVTLGQAYRLDGSRTEDHHEVVESLNLARGSHQWSLGASVHAVRLEARLADRFGGIFVFPTLDDFLRGTPDVFLQAFGDPRTRLRTSPLGWWVQDRWQPATGLTVEAGLRYDLQFLPNGFPAATRNFAPRFGLAWRPGARAPWVLRAGFGLFYDRFPLAYLHEAVQKDGARGFEQYLAGAGAARAFAVARGGPLPAPLAGAPLSAYRLDGEFPSTYSRKFTAGIERGLDRDTRLTAEYAAVSGFHLPRLRNVAGGLPAAYQLEQNARSTYHGTSISLNRRMNRELAFLVTYNVGHTWDDASDYDEQPMDPRNVRLDWARSRQHQRHRLAASALFELPEEAAPRRLRKALEDIVVAPIITAASGRPVNALDSTDSFRTGAYPISARPFGVGRNPFLGPGIVAFDVRVMKGVWLKERRAILQMGVEAFNLANHSNPLRVSATYAAAGARLASYRQPAETLNARQLQLVVQLEY